MQNSEESLQTSQHSRDWYKLAEYASIAGSAVGSLAAAWYQQIIFAATPLTLALAFNFINRQRFEQTIRQNLDATIKDVHHLVKSVHEEVQTLPSESTDLDPITDVLTELQRVTQRLEKNALRQEDWDVMNVRVKLLKETVEELKEAIAHAPVDSEGSDLQVLATSLEGLVTQSTSDLSVLQTQVNQLRQEINELQSEQQTLIKPYLKRLVIAVQKLKGKN